MPKRRRTWCGDACATAFWTNHWWTLARRAARRRGKYRCARCGRRAPKRPLPAAFARPGAYAAAMRVWRAARKAERLEVNHIDPCLGRHGVLSCAHHLSNLEVLCPPCHRAYTAASRRTAAAG